LPGQLGNRAYLGNAIFDPSNEKKAENCEQKKGDNKLIPGGVALCAPLEAE
jgi:hypothetical protein